MFHIAVPKRKSLIPVLGPHRHMFGPGRICAVMQAKLACSHGTPRRCNILVLRNDKGAFRFVMLVSRQENLTLTNSFINVAQTTPSHSEGTEGAN